MNGGKWQFWIDRGGTFTDVVARRPDGSMATAKLLSEDPSRYDDAAVAAIRQLTGIADGALPPADIRIGTTIATNALLERKGERVLLAVTAGFADCLAVGSQERPDIFALRIDKPEPLTREVIEIGERVLADGTVERTLDEAAARASLQAAHDRGLRAVAIALMHGFRFPAHEARLAAIAAEIGFTEIATSHRVSPLARLVPRAETVLADAYLSPVLARYVAGFTAALGPGQAPLFMQSNGGLAGVAGLRGKDAVLSGPAGGIVGMAETGRRAGFDRVIGFDMGGTSTDVALFAGGYERSSDNRVAGVRIAMPMMRIHTVAAGGGSICGFSEGRFVVGPESAGAQPGPACYRQGGPLTLTDCNLILGKLQPAHFPAVFGPGGDQPLDLSASQARLDAVLAALEAETGREMAAAEAAAGFIAIAVANMANAIRAVSLARGFDPARFALNCFGGAGGQHACLVAEALGIETVLVHPLAGVLSAYGMGLADRQETREVSLGLPLEDAGGVTAACDRLGAEATEALVVQGVARESIETVAEAHLRPANGLSTIAVPFSSPDAMRAAFAEEHRARFGFDNAAPLVVEQLRVDAIAREGHAPPLPDPVAGGAPTPSAQVAAFMAGETRQVPVYQRDDLPAGSEIAGPALVIDPVATLVVEPGWRAETGAEGMLVLTGMAKPEPTLSGTEADTAGPNGAEPDPVRLEIFGALFMAVAEEMGAALQHSARSVNIRERLDFSCAVFDATGQLVANAPHIPVHLGSMSASVQAVIAHRGAAMREGEAYALNAPYDGGTHLPDITVVKPVFVEGQSAPRFFVAARGHHADIGGIAPGSMPPGSTTIDEEGVVLDDVLVLQDGAFLEEELRALLSAGPCPARNVDQNLADLAAQLAACQRGAERLLALVGTYSLDVVTAYMDHLLDHAEQAARKVLRRFPGGAITVPMDNGAQVAVAISVDAGTGDTVIDFAGTSAQLSDNFNAPAPVVRAACLYALRLIADLPVPLNDGFLRPVTIRVPTGSMLAPQSPAAVVAGNVETSQILTDAILGALGAMAASQGTMNNLTFGDARHQYYETICGGAGAGADFAGADAVQTHMTNSRITDPEIIEARFPVVVERFAIRQGSGGAGHCRGGDGVERCLRFLAPMQANILSGRRASAPFGLAGGGDGLPGRNRIIRADGNVEELPATASAQMQPGDAFEVLTPGGGGYGKA